VVGSHRNSWGVDLIGKPKRGEKQCFFAGKGKEEAKKSKANNDIGADRCLKPRQSPQLGPTEQAVIYVKKRTARGGKTTGEKRKVKARKNAAHLSFRGGKKGKIREALQGEIGEKPRNFPSKERLSTIAAKGVSSCLSKGLKGHREGCT